LELRLDVIRNARPLQSRTGGGGVAGHPTGKNLLQLVIVLARFCQG
jgi:hypothetical protein